MLMSRFNLAYVLEGAKLENWGRGGGGQRGHIWQGRRGIGDGVICLGGDRNPWGGGAFAPLRPLD